jgi:quinol monooxygenase YgiN
MYLHLELKTIPTGLREQAVDRLTRLHELMAATDGFLSAQMWADVSDSLEYMVTRAWVDAAAHCAYRSSDAAKAFAASRPPVPLWENTAVQEWISASQVKNLWAGNFLARRVQADEPGRPAVGNDHLAIFRNLAPSASGEARMALWRFTERSELERMQPGAESSFRGYQLISEIVR